MSRLLNYHSDKWVPEPNTGCYLWLGAIKIRTKRPVIKYGGKWCTAARVFCEEAHGPPPTLKHEAAHKRGCVGGMCVNPIHLYWATRSQNMMDRPAEMRIRIAKTASDAYYRNKSEEDK